MSEPLTLDKKESEVLCKIFQWAYTNQICVTLYPERVPYGHGDTYPMLRFRRDYKTYEVAFMRFAEESIARKMDHYWREISLALCVEPLDLSEFL